MNGHENLIPVRTKEEASKIGRIGGIKSGETRRKKKTLEQMAKMMLEGKITDTAKTSIKRSGIDLNQFESDDINGMAYMLAGQVKAAAQGNVNAFENVVKYAVKSEGQDAVDKHYTIPITDVTIDFVEVYRKVHEAFETGCIREIISKGGRGSIKSNFWAAVVEETIYNDPQAHCVYTRRFKTDLRGSVYNQFMKTIIRHGKLDEWTFTTSPMMAKYNKTGQCVIFVGADKPISLKSYNLSFGYVKLLIHEECDEMAGVEQCDNIEDTFLRSDVNAIDIKVFNPPKSANNFMNKYTAEKMADDKTFICHSYFFNVPLKWLGQRFFDRAKWFEINKPKYYKNNYLGEVVGTGGTVFENVLERTITDDEIAGLKYFYNGLDWGFTHPQAFVRCSYNAETDTVVIVEELRKINMKQQTFASRLKKYKNKEIIADSEAPDKINDWNDWGFDIVPATKRWKGGGRDYAWEWLQTVKNIVVDPVRTPFIAKELREAEHELLKDGSFSSKYPTLNEDCICALIYSLNRVIIDSKKEDLYDDYDEESEDYDD